MDRDEVHQQIRDYLGENPLGTPKFLAVSDFMEQQISEAAVRAASTVAQETGFLGVKNYSLQCLMRKVAVSETIRVRQDTVPGYGAAFKHVKHKIFPSLLVAEGFKPQSEQYWYLASVAATNLSVGLLSEIRGL